ncbi:MAG: T9SS type A sorting domain-containing protein [Chitinophagales bacterium]
MSSRTLLILHLLPMLIYSLAFVENAQGQPSNTFQKNYSFSIGSYPAKIISAKDSGYLIAGVQSDESVGNGDGYILKMDAHGTTEWINGYNRPNADFIIYTATQLPDSSYIVLCDPFENRAIIQKITKDGSLIWQKSYDVAIGALRFYEILSLNDGSFIAAGERRTGPINTVISKFDTDGNILWQKECKHSDDLINFPGKILLINDTLLICGGVQKPLVPNADTIFLMKMNPTNGDFYNAKKIWLDSGKIISLMFLQKSIDSLVLAASFSNSAAGTNTDAIIQINQTLAITQSIKLSAGPVGVFVASTLAQDSNSFAFAFQDVTNNRGVLMKFDEGLNPVFAKSFPQNFNGVTASSFINVAPCLDSGFIIGASNLKVDSVFSYFIKTDKNGETDSCTTINVPVSTQPLNLSESGFSWASVDPFTINITSANVPPINLPVNEITMCNGSFALPVKLISFTAKAVNQGCLLKWQTAAEINNRGFEVEHSTNAINYINIGFVASTGNTNTNSDYSFTHSLPAAGKNYYRLKQVDIDGQFTYSKAERVDFNNLNAAIIIFPNPVVNEILFTGALSEGSEIKIINTTGQVVERGFISGHKYLPKKLRAGAYYVMITDKKNSLSFSRQIMVLE